MCKLKELAASTIKSEAREFVVDSGVSMYIVSKKDLNSAELETVRISKSATTVVAANGEVLTKEEATVYVRELDLFVTAKLPKIHWQSSQLEHSAKVTGVTSIGPVVRNHNSSTKAGRSIATQRSTYPSMSLVYRQALQPHLHLLLLHLHRRKP